jgi:hypothetical protein
MVGQHESQAGQVCVDEVEDEDEEPPLEPPEEPPDEPLPEEDGDATQQCGHDV